MVGTRKTPSGRATATLDGSPVIEAVDDDDDDDMIDIIDQSSVGFLPFWVFPYVDFLGTAHFYAALLGHHLR
jgi:hypothetical protein